MSSSQRTAQCPRWWRKATKAVSKSRLAASGASLRTASRSSPGRAVEEALAVGEDQQAAAVALGLLDVVGGEDHRRPAPGELADELPEPRPLARVEADAGLVEEQRDRPREQPDRNVDPLLVAAREPRDRLAAAPGEARKLEHLLDRGARVLVSLQPREEQQVLLDREPSVERRLLRDPADRPARQHDLAAVGLGHPGQDREQRRLAGPVRPDHRHQLSGLGQRGRRP